MRLFPLLEFSELKVIRWKSLALICDVRAVWSCHNQSVISPDVSVVYGLIREYLLMSNCGVVESLNNESSENNDSPEKYGSTENYDCPENNDSFETFKKLFWNLFETFLKLFNTF